MEAGLGLLPWIARFSFADVRTQHTAFVSMYQFSRPTRRDALRMSGSGDGAEFMGLFEQTFRPLILLGCGSPRGTVGWIRHARPESF